MTHEQLTIIAEKWLQGRGCGVTFRELVTRSRWGEIPDAIGWRDGVSILVEAKASRSDFLADRSKPFRVIPENGMGDWRFYLCPPGVIKPNDLPPDWGLLYAHNNRVECVHGVPKGNTGWGQPPFSSNRRSETVMLVSALRRLKLRGVLPMIYEPLKKDDVASIPNLEPLS